MSEDQAVKHDDLPERVALELIVLDLGRLVAQAGTINQPMLAYLLELARVEARSQLDGTPISASKD